MPSNREDRLSTNRGGNLGQDSIIQFDSMRIKWV